MMKNMSWLMDNFALFSIDFFTAALEYQVGFR